MYMYERPKFSDSLTLFQSGVPDYTNHIGFVSPKFQDYAMKK